MQMIVVLLLAIMAVVSCINAFHLHQSMTKVVHQVHPSQQRMKTVCKAVEMVIPEGSDPNQAMAAFKRLVKKSGVAKALRAKAFHESAAEKAKRKAKQAKINKRYYRMNMQRYKAVTAGTGEYQINYEIPILHF
jgi:ribosomal protein S21